MPYSHQQRMRGSPLLLACSLICCSDGRSEGYKGSIYHACSDTSSAAGSAKLSGSGGAVVVLLPDRAKNGEQFEETCRQEGFDVYEATCGLPSAEVNIIV